MSPVQTNNNTVPSISEDMSSTCSTTSPTPAETHSCPYNDCNKSFSKKYNLKAHLRLHTGEQPFECDRPDCRKKFKWRSSLSSHSVWHTRKDNANAAVSPPTTTTKSCSPSSKSASQQKMCSSRAVRVAPHPPAQRVNMNTTTSRKRPRAEVSSSSLHSTQPLVVDHSRLSSSPARLKTKSATRPTVKKRRSRPAADVAPMNKGVVVTQVKKQNVEEDDVFIGDMGSAPGSPVTSDGSNSEQALDVDEFSCDDILQPLLTGDGEVGGIIGGEEGQLFGYDESISCVPLGGFDSRFEQFDLDNFANFYLNKMEGGL